MIWYLVNVVWYDGVEAYVTKFVLPVNEKYELEKSTKDKVKKYLDGNGEVLKFDLCYFVTLENIIAYKDDIDKNCIYERFNEMYFGKGA